MLFTIVKTGRRFDVVITDSARNQRMTFDGRWFASPAVASEGVGFNLPLDGEFKTRKAACAAIEHAVLYAQLIRGS